MSGQVFPSSPQFTTSFGPIDPEVRDYLLDTVSKEVSASLDEVISFAAVLYSKRALKKCVDYMVLHGQLSLSEDGILSLPKLENKADMQAPAPRF